MFKHDRNIVDNTETLVSVKKDLGKSFNILISLWKDTPDKKSYYDFFLKTKYNKSPFQDALIKALEYTSKEAKDLISDDLFDIFIGVSAVNDTSGNTYLPYFFIFRCSNNGRSLIVSEAPIPSL